MTFSQRTPEQRNRDRLRRKELRARTQQKQIDTIRLRAFAYIAGADGAINASESRFAKAHGVALGSTETARRTGELRDLQRLYTAAFTISARRTLLRELKGLALCDGPLSDEERDALEKLSETLKIQRTRPSASRLANRSFRGARVKGSRSADHEPDPPLPWCYEFLGCTPDDSDHTIKTAYRRLAVRYHPDKHTSLANDPEAMRLHVEAFQKLQTAYDEVQRLRGTQL